MSWWARLASLLLVVGIVLSPLRAVAAPFPMLFAYDVAVRPTTTTVLVAGVQPTGTTALSGRDAAERPAFNGYDPGLVAYDSASNPGVGPVHAYDDALEHAPSRCDMGGEEAIYDAPAVTTAAEGFSTAGRAAQLADAIPAAQAGRITMGVGLAEDANGARSVLIGTSEPGGYLRGGMSLAPGETMAAGTGHAEADIVGYAQANGLQLLEVGATRPICPTCAALIEGAGATPVTPLRVVP